MHTILMVLLIEPILQVSEGIDFSDKAGRGVVITGLPFPAAHDPHVKLQKQLLDEEASAGQNGIMGGRGLSGEQWWVCHLWFGFRIACFCG